MHDREVPVTELGASGPRLLVVPLDDGSGRFGQQAPQSRVGLGFGVGHVVNDLTRAPASFDMAIEVVVVDDFGVVQEMRGGHAVGRHVIGETHDFSFALLGSTTRVRPSWTIEVMSWPPSLKRKPRARPRPPWAIGESMS